MSEKTAAPITRKTALDRARAALDKLTPDELAKLRGEIDLLLSAYEAIDAAHSAGVIADGARAQVSGQQGGYVEWKYITGKDGVKRGPYKYLRWRENGRLHSKYLKG